VRPILAAVCLVLACVTPAAALSAWWVYGQATDTARFTETARPLATDATVQNAVVDELVRRTGAPARLRPAAEALVRTKAYQKTWRAIQRSAHARLAVRLTGDVQTPLTLDLAPVAAILRERIAATGLTVVADRIADPAPVVLLNRAEVRRAHNATNNIRIVRGPRPARGPADRATARRRPRSRWPMPRPLLAAGRRRRRVRAQCGLGSPAPGGL
jgi:hypothetical protein